MASRLLLAALFTTAVAHAQSSTGPTMMCSNPSLVTATFGLAIKDAKSAALTDIAPTLINTVLNLAECRCEAGDLVVTARMINTTITNASVPMEVWTGQNCNQQTNRMTGATACTKLNAEVNSGNFAKTSSSLPQQTISVRALVNPANFNSPSTPSTNFCAGTSASNGVWFLFNPQNAMPDYCSITLPTKTLAPTGPSGLTSQPGEGAVTLSWTAPPTTSVPIKSYQVLCADQTGNPVSSLQSQFATTSNQAYSTCTPSGLRRRTLSTGGPILVSDGGTTTDASVAPSSEPLHPDHLDPDDEPIDGGVTDAALVDAGEDMATVDMALPPQFTEGPSPFVSLDPKFICSTTFQNTQTSWRIDGLENGKTYQFAVVAIDDVGNPAASNVALGTPQPVEDLFRRFRAAGGGIQCATGTRSGSATMVAALAALLLLHSLRRRRR